MDCTHKMKYWIIYNMVMLLSIWDHSSQRMHLENQGYLTYKKAAQSPRCKPIKVTNITIGTDANNQMKKAKNLTLNTSSCKCSLVKSF